MKVTMIVATTVDGFIARSTDEHVNWTEDADKEFFVEKTNAIGTVIMGMNTYRALPKPLPDGNLRIVMSSSPDIGDAEPGKVEFFTGDPEELLQNL